MLTYLLLLLLAGVVATDTTSGPQMLFSEPLVSCSIGGIIVGDTATGIEIGMMFQLLWIGYMPLGAVRFTDSNMGAIIALASLYTAGDLFSLAGSDYQAAVIPALIVGIAAGLAGSRFRNRVRRFNNSISETLLGKVGRGEIPSPTPWHMLGIGASFFRGTFMAILFIPV
ncbi:MAG: PTS sugar transporter subunit IIC, partial [Candidatus Latescibacteria bacterium]|nr:PTS sugar transporter subunit IIC [Candidatus Latescibacterota bacterium]